ncbi:MAG: adenylate/guanylate cyclase domain-containing protein [Flavobacteriales bacterium]
MRTTTLCQGCLEQMHMPIAIRGPFSLLFRPFGITRSQMHPNLCTICESMFIRVKKQKQIEIETTILFADLRGYTRLSETMPAARVNQLLHGFYDQCSMAIWERDGIVNKFIGDAVLAIFNFPLVRADHVGNALKAAIELQRRCTELHKDLAPEEKPGIGIGIHTGTCNMGEVGNAYKDFTVIGPVVNLASRLQGAAQPGEILLSDDVFQHLHRDLPPLEMRPLSLKGIDQPVRSHVIGEKVLDRYRNEEVMK